MLESVLPGSLGHELAVNVVARSAVTLRLRWEIFHGRPTIGLRGRVRHLIRIWSYQQIQLYFLTNPPIGGRWASLQYRSGWLSLNRSISCTGDGDVFCGLSRKTAASHNASSGAGSLPF
jgi:hypothetical protein